MKPLTRCALALFCFGSLASQARSATPPSPFRYMLLTDGAEVWPKDTLATKTEVSAATNAVANVATNVSGQQAAVAALGSRVATLEETLADLSKDGVWVLEGYINSIGIVSGTPEYDGAISIVHLTVTDSATDPAARTLKLWAAFEPAPVAASQVAMVGNTALADAFGDLTYTCSFPDKVANPNDPADTRAIYTFAADYPKASTAGFAKLISLPGSGVGVGNYLPVSGGLSINGVNGATATLTADDGTVLTFKGGILVEATPVTTLSEAAQ